FDSGQLNYPSVRFLLRHDGERQALCVPDDHKLGRAPDARVGQLPVQVVYPCDGLIVEADDDVARAQARLLRRTVRLERDNEDARLDRQLIVAHELAHERHVLPGDADVATPDAPVADQTPGDELRRVNRSCKADALRRTYDGGFDADDETARRH